MSSRTSWLLALVACVACFDAGAHAQVAERVPLTAEKVPLIVERIPLIAEKVPLKILVIQPKTERLLYLADVSIFTNGTPPVCIREGSTGHTGEPFEAEAEQPLDTALQTLVVVAEHGGVRGTTEILYNPKLGAWQQPDRYEFDAEAGDWRHLVFDPATGDWQLSMYDYAAERWRLDGTYKYHAARDRWWLWWFDYGTGKWWQRNLYEREQMLGQAEGRWKLTKVRHPEDEELSNATRKEQENWRLPANDSGLQLVRLRMPAAHVIPVWNSSHLPPATERPIVPAYYVPAPGCCR